MDTLVRVGGGVGGRAGEGGNPVRGFCTSESGCSWLQLGTPTRSIYALTASCLAACMSLVLAGPAFVTGGALRAEATLHRRPCHT
jgi:hypothetical protein